MSAPVATSDGIKTLDEFCAWTAAHPGKACPDEVLFKLDEHGFLAGANEDDTAFAKRLTQLSKGLRECRQSLTKKGEFTLDPEFTFASDDFIPSTEYACAAPITEAAYGFHVDWVPGFYPKKNLGALWAGCTLVSEKLPYPIFTLRKEFRHSETYLKIYGKTELLAHEICHAARAPMDDPSFEEHFAYAISGSPLRRLFGNCFRSERDALLFLTPVLAAIAQVIVFSLGYKLDPWLWRSIFVLCCLPMGYLFLRNFLDRRTVRTAHLRLKHLSVSQPDAVMFRCPAAEIRALASGRLDPLQAWQGPTPRERVIRGRFLQQKAEKASDVD